MNRFNVVFCRKFSSLINKNQGNNDLQAEIIRLKRELKCVEQERNILKEAALGSSDQSNSYIKILICRGTFNDQFG